MRGNLSLFTTTIIYVILSISRIFVNREGIPRSFEDALRVRRLKLMVSMALLPIVTF